MLSGVSIMRADPSALSLGVTRTAGRRSARCQGVELSKGGGGGAWCSAIRAERAHCFGRYFLSSHEEAQVLADDGCPRMAWSDVSLLDHAHLTCRRLRSSLIDERACRADAPGTPGGRGVQTQAASAQSVSPMEGGVVWQAILMPPSDCHPELPCHRGRGLTCLRSKPGEATTSAAEHLLVHDRESCHHEHCLAKCHQWRVAAHPVGGRRPERRVKLTV